MVLCYCFIFLLSFEKLFTISVVKVIDYAYRIYQSIVSVNIAGDYDVPTNVVNRRFSEDLHELASLCLHRESYDRPTACQLLTHPIFKTLKKALPLPELLKPALPLSDRVGYDTGRVSRSKFVLESN